AAKCSRTEWGLHVDFDRDRTKRRSSRSRRALSRYVAGFHLFWSAAWSPADVEQCSVYRRSSCFGSVVRPVLAAAADAGARDRRRPDRASADAVSDWWKRKDPHAAPYSLGLHN